MAADDAVPESLRCAICGERARGNAWVDGRRVCMEDAPITCHLIALLESRHRAFQP